MNIITLFIVKEALEKIEYLTKRLLKIVKEEVKKIEKADKKMR